MVFYSALTPFRSNHARPRPPDFETPAIVLTGVAAALGAVSGAVPDLAEGHRVGGVRERHADGQDAGYP